MRVEARERFAQIIKDLRSGRDFRTFAYLVGVSHPTVIAWENCQTVPKRENLEKVAELRGETLDQLLNYLEDTEPVSPQDRLMAVIKGASKEQLVVFLKAITDRLEKI